jgi:hypothetical protein
MIILAGKYKIGMRIDENMGGLTTVVKSSSSKAKESGSRSRAFLFGGIWVSELLLSDS